MQAGIQTRDPHSTEGPVTNYTTTAALVVLVVTVTVLVPVVGSFVYVCVYNRVIIGSILAFSVAVFLIVIVVTDVASASVLVVVCDVPIDPLHNESVPSFSPSPLPYLQI